jgi:hypothetical protein
MRMTERVTEIMETNLAEHFIPLILQSDDHTLVFPVYFARMIDENQIAIPVTDATHIEESLDREMPATAVVADRPGGYEAYVLQGRAHRVTDAEDYEFVQAMRNEVPGFPIHGAVIFEVESAHPVPPP